MLSHESETQLAAEARSLICLATRERRLVPPRRLAAFAGLAQSSYLAVPLGRFMLRALHDDLATRRGWRSRDGVRLGRQSLADLGWWAELRGSKHVGRAIWRPAETRLLHTDASDLGWGAAVDLAQRHAPAHGAADCEAVKGQRGEVLGRGAAQLRVDAAVHTKIGAWKFSAPNWNMCWYSGMVMQRV